MIPAVNDSSKFLVKLTVNDVNLVVTGFQNTSIKHKGMNIS